MTDKETMAMIKQMVADGQISQEVAEKYFPELKEKESEDEKIRKELIEYLKERKSCECYGQYVVRYDRWIAWLEKQGEQKPAWSEEDRILQDSSISYLCNLRDTFETKGWDKEQIQKCINWLQSLSPQSQWKLGKRYEEALLWCIAHLGGADRQTLTELLKQLKAL